MPTHDAPGPKPMSSIRPQRSSGVRSYTLGSELLLYVGEDDTAIALNSSALAIWSLVDGDRTVAEIVEVIADEASVSGEDILKDVLEALDDFVELGVMTLTAPGPPS